MEDSLELEQKNDVSMSNLNDEIDPLDAYMLEIDQQVQTLDEKDKIKKQEDTPVTISDNKNNSDEDEEEEETIGKAGNFATVEELIA